MTLPGIARCLIWMVERASFLSAASNGNPALRRALLERKSMAASMRGKLEAEGIEVIEGDLLTDPIPAGFDAVLVAKVIHLFTPEINQQILRRIRSSARAGTRCCLSIFGWIPGTGHPILGPCSRANSRSFPAAMFIAPVR
ncbi:MAG: methyltransferase [Bryobacteraceae bacterium]